MKTDQRITIDEIWEQFHKTHDEQYRNMLMEHYRSLVRYCAERLHSKLPDKVELDDLINIDLKRLFPAKNGEPAAGYIHANREGIIRDVHNWTGIDVFLVTDLVSELEARLNDLGLTVSSESHTQDIARLAVFVTTLAMNYQTTGEFMEK